MKYCHPEAVTYFVEADFRERLNAIYETIEEGHCKGCTKCCSESVNTFFAEYLNLRLTLKAQGELAFYEKACLEYYLTELVQPMKCPLLKPDGRCAAYLARPLPCRVFGHLEQTAYEANYEAILENNLAMADALLTDLQIKVPDAVIHKKIDFCQDFVTPKPLTEGDRDDLVDDLFSLDSRMLAKGLLDFEAINLSLVQWFAYDLMGREQAEACRIQVSQEISKVGSSITLLQTLESLT